MKRRSFLLCVIMLLPLVGVFAQTPKPTILEVHVTYTGAGTVDESHKLFVTLWDTPDFAKQDAAGIAPIATMPITSKSGTATFADIQKNPVYVSLGYDPTGKWDAQSEPPSGTSLGLYSTEPGVPAPLPLEPGKTTKVSATLDDSYTKP
jgi:hypothetical protein